MNDPFSRFRTLSLLSMMCLAALAVGCDGAETDTGGTTTTTGTEPDPEPEDKIFTLKGGWNTFEPGGDTVCSRGTPYRYFVRPGKVNKLVIEFRGGGACWNNLTCGIAGSLFQEEADADPWVVDEAQATGIYDHSRDDNPFKDWHHVYIPYCTGDIHWGNNEMTYGSGTGKFTIQHKGAVNVQKVLDWTYEHVTAPEQVMVTGCSAGAYGSIMWSSHVREHYQKAKVLQLADSGAGVITETFFQDSFPSWKPEGSYPTWIPGVVPEDVTRLPQLYQIIGNHYSDMLLSQYNTAYDEDQAFYFSAMGGGDTYEWSKQMNAHVGEIADSTPNFASYQAAGFQHCIIPLDELYTVEVGGVKLVDWIGQMIEGQQPEDVACAGDACGAPK
jgi:hypothetical protein